MKSSKAPKVGIWYKIGTLAFCQNSQRKLPQQSFRTGRRCDVLNFMSVIVDLDIATRIAEEHVARLLDGDLELKLLPEQTIERDFGWVFFYGLRNPSVRLAGNAPFIVDRKDGSVHVTGTAYPIEEYLQSYARIGRTYPFAVPEHAVVLSGWKPGMLKVSLTKAIRRATGMDLPSAKRCTDDVLARKPVALTFSTPVKADEFHSEAEKLGAVVERRTQFR